MNYYKYNKNFITLIVPLLFSNYRVDVILPKYLTQYSRVDIINFINNNCLFINNKISKNIFLLKFKYFIKFNVVNFLNKIFLISLSYFIPIIYEDNYIIIINKPPGVIIHPAPNNWNFSLINFLLYYYGKNIINLFRFGIIHRLDKYTTGLLVICKSNSIYINFLKQMKLGLINKYYISFLLGKLNASKKVLGYINLFYKKKKKNFLFKEFKSISISNFSLFNTFKLYNGNYYYDISVVKCNLLTGKTHQIRIHLSYLGYPVISDDIYNIVGFKNVLGNFLPRLALHSYYISFFHPIFNYNNFCKISLYSDMLNLFKLLY